MRLHGMFSNRKLIRDKFIRVSLPDQGQYLDFPCGQRLIRRMIRKSEGDFCSGSPGLSAVSCKASE